MAKRKAEEYNEESMQTLMVHLKATLIAKCRTQGLPVIGTKARLAQRLVAAMQAGAMESNPAGPLLKRRRPTVIEVDIDSEVELRKDAIPGSLRPLPTAAESAPAEPPPKAV